MVRFCAFFHFSVNITPGTGQEDGGISNTSCNSSDCYQPPDHHFGGFSLSSKALEKVYRSVEKGGWNEKININGINHCVDVQ